MSNAELNTASVMMAGAEMAEAMMMGMRMCSDVQSAMLRG